MAVAVFDLIVGSNEPIVVQLYPLSDEGGSAGISLSGATSVAAHAKPAAGGTTVALTATVSDTANGKVTLNYATGDFAMGTWQLQIKFLDGAGKQRRYPSEDQQLLLRVNAKTE